MLAIGGVLGYKVWEGVNVPAVRGAMQIADVGLKCPKCGIRFSSRMPPTIEDTGYRDSELRVIPNTQEDKFEQYCVSTCPSCGKSDWAVSFKPTTDETFAIRQQSIPPHLQYRTAAVEAERSGGRWYSVGMYYLYAAWCADDIGAGPQGKEYRRLAVDAFSKSLRDDSCPLIERPTIEYLIGEIMRRGGAFSESLQHFKQAIPRLPGRYALMARRVMRLADISNSEPIPFDTTGD